MPTCSVKLNGGYGADRPAAGKTMLISRVERGDNGEMIVTPGGSPIPVTYPFGSVDLEQGVAYRFVEQWPGGITTYKQVPATAEADYSDLADVIPLPPSGGILGDALVSGLVGDPDSDTRAALLASLQPADPALTEIAALNPTNGQAIAWSDTLGAWTVANPAGALKIASAINATTVVTSIATTGGVGTPVVVPSTTIAVPNSGGRNVTLKLKGGFAQDAVGAGSVWLMIWEGANFLFAAIMEIPNSTDPSLNTITIPPHELDIGAVTTTRTFHLQALLYSPVGQSAQGHIVNSANTPTSLEAIAL